MEDQQTYTLEQAFNDSATDKKRQRWEDPYKAWRESQDPNDLRQVVSSLDNTISSASRAHAGQAARSPVVQQRARLIAARAVKSFDPDRGVALPTHVNNQLRELQRSAPAVVDPLSPPERFRRQQVEISQVTQDLEEQLGREATDEEISEVSGIPLPRVVKVRRRMRARIPTSVYEDSDDDDDALDVVDNRFTDEDLWHEAVYHDLGEVDRIIFMHRTGYRDADILSNTDIAQRVNLSPGAVSQRARRIQQRLEQYHAR